MCWCFCRSGLSEKRLFLCVLHRFIVFILGFIVVQANTYLWSIDFIFACFCCLKLVLVESIGVLVLVGNQNTNDSCIFV